MGDMADDAETAAWAAGYTGNPQNPWGQTYDLTVDPGVVRAERLLDSVRKGMYRIRAQDPTARFNIIVTEAQCRSLERHRLSKKYRNEPWRAEEELQQAVRDSIDFGAMLFGSPVVVVPTEEEAGR